MTLHELHYTSVHAGPGGSSGFQFIKLTDGVDPGLCRQVEPLLGYEPPRGSPARPTLEDIAEFPVALSYTLLPQGGAVLCNTTYTGVDYSGRYGNFYAHALHLPSGADDLGAILPIETWRSRSWCTQPGGSDSAVAASEVERGTITDPALCRIVQQNGPRIEAFLTDILSSFGEARKRILLVESNTDTVALWIALACRSLPSALAGRLTFTTYTQRPYLSAYQVTGMPVDADFAFSEAEITSQYRVHDTAGRSSPLAQPLAWATAAVALWQAGKPQLFSKAYFGFHIPPSGLDAAQLDALTGELAATAVANDVEVPAAVLSATVAWAETHPSEGTPHFWENLAIALKDGRGELPVTSLGRLCRTVSMYQPAVTVPMLTAYLSALPAALLQDPHLDTGMARWAIGRLTESPDAAETAAAAVRSIMPHAFQPGLTLDRGLMLMELADALEIQDIPARAATQLLAPALLASGGDAADAAGFLAATPNATLREQTLACLHDEARASSGPGAPELANAVTGWTQSVDLIDFPLLHAAADIEHARRDGQPADNAAAFCRVVQILRDTDLEDISSYALRMACPSQPPTASEAREMLTCIQQPADQGTQLDRTCLELVRNTTQLDADIVQLAELLRARAGYWMDSRDTALLDLVTATERLEAATRQPGYAGVSESVVAVLRLIDASSPVPQPVREAATAALLTTLLSPQRLEQPSPSLRSELRELTVRGDDDLIAAYVRQAYRELTRSLTRSPSLHACCFTLWWHEEGPPGGTAWPAARDGLVGDLLRATAYKMTDVVTAQTAAELDRLQEGLSQEWLRLTQPSRGARPGMLSWARHILQRPGRHPRHGNRGNPRW